MTEDKLYTLDELSAMGLDVGRVEAKTWYKSMPYLKPDGSLETRAYIKLTDFSVKAIVPDDVELSKDFVARTWEPGPFLSWCYMIGHIYFRVFDRGKLKEINIIIPEEPEMAGYTP